LFGEEAVARKLPHRRRGAATVSDPDTVIVGATKALGEYDEVGAYICQPERSFRDVDYLGFYSNRTIDPRFPKIIARCKNVPFTREEIARRRAETDGAPIADVIERALDGGSREEGKHYQIVLLSLDDGFRLEQPIAHPVEVARSAWTQYQRYSRRDALKSNPQPRTTAELAGAGG
jgi:hypothetical protein